MMQTDIVERLRAAAKHPYNQHGPNEWLGEAAAEIERLRAENASLSSWQCEFTDGKTGLVYSEGGGTYCAMAKKLATLRADNERLRTEVATWRGHAKTAIWSDSEECKLLTADNERLRAALQWFVDEYDKVQPMRQARMHNPGCRCVLCAYDNARAVLAEEKNG
jgi:hypothetical protein